MNYYLIDFENIKTAGVKELVKANEGDAIIIFYSEQCKGITLDVIENITNNNVKLNCYKVKTGKKNALDFQLSSHLGYMIGKSAVDTKYHIVSNDKGYDCLCDYWKEQGVVVDRIGATEPVKELVEIKVAPTPAPKKKSKVKTSDLATIEEIKKYLSKGDDPEEVLVIFNQYKTKQAICNGMSKKFKDSKRTSAIYKKLKPLLKEKNKT